MLVSFLFCEKWERKYIIKSDSEVWNMYQKVNLGMSFTFTLFSLEKKMCTYNITFPDMLHGEPWLDFKVGFPASKSVFPTEAINLQVDKEL